MSPTEVEVGASGAAGTEPEADEASEDEPRPTALVVEAGAWTRDRMGRWLEDAGFEVLLCPGPTGPDYTCTGARNEACPLVSAADVVVLDMWLESDRMMVGSPAFELLVAYLGRGLPVVAVMEGMELPLGAHDRQLAVLTSPPQPDQVVAAARKLLEGRGVPVPSLPR